MKKPPIAIFAYNRPRHLKLALEALSQSETFFGESFKKIIYCDAPKKEEDTSLVLETREIAKKDLSCEVVCREKNLGFKNITLGITEQCDLHGKTIVIEDDVIVAPDFLSFMMEAFQKYDQNEKVFMVSGFMYHGLDYSQKTPFFLHAPFIWGWGVWERGWKHFDWHPKEWDQILKDRKKRHFFDFYNSHPFSKSLQKTMEGKWNTWDTQWMYAVFKAQGLALYPPRSLVWNCGVGGGVHGNNPKQDPLACLKEKYIHGDQHLEDFQKPRLLLLGKSLPDVVECDKMVMRRLAIIFLEERLRKGEKKKWRLRLKLYLQKIIVFFLEKSP